MSDGIISADAMCVPPPTVIGVVASCGREPESSFVNRSGKRLRALSRLCVEFKASKINVAKTNEKVGDGVPLYR